MKVIFAWLILLLGIFLTSCQGFSFTIPAKAELPGVCIYNGIMLKQGDNSLLSACQNMHCNEDGSILVQGCGHFDMRDCRVLDPINLHKPYPECCKMNFFCTLANGQTINREVQPLDTGVYA